MLQIERSGVRHLLWATNGQVHFMMESLEIESVEYFVNGCGAEYPLKTWQTVFDANDFVAGLAALCNPRICVVEIDAESWTDDHSDLCLELDRVRIGRYGVDAVSYEKYSGSRIFVNLADKFSVDQIKAVVDEAIALAKGN